MSNAGTVNEVLTRSVGECGRLDYVSATAVAFKPYNGDALKINGAIYQIPASGIVGLANTGVYVNGVAGQNLAASTRYYVYAFVNAGVVTGDFSTTTHATSTAAANSGVEIKSGDETRSLIGMVYTNASSQFSNTYKSKLVISWFNRLVNYSYGDHTNSYQASVLSPLAVMASACDFVTWGEEAVFLGIHGWISNTAGYYSRFSLGVDGTTSFVPTSPGLDVLGYQNSSPAYWITPSMYLARFLTEGYHYIVPVVWVGGGLGTFTISGRVMFKG